MLLAAMEAFLAAPQEEVVSLPMAAGWVAEEQAGYDQIVQHLVPSPLQPLWM